MSEWKKICHKRPLMLLGAILVVVALVAAACGEEGVPQADYDAVKARLQTKEEEVAKAQADLQTLEEQLAAVAPHEVGATHPFQPKRLEAVIEIDMGEFHFANPQGQKNPIFRLPAGKTVGIHIHNEGAIVHELAIGRKLATSGEYEELLTELVPSDLFFYYGQTKAEVEDAEFGELEVEPGVRDVWLRMNVPLELKGEWEFGCFVEGHYEHGMHAELIFE